LGSIGGVVLIILGFLYDVMFAGIPYQDPTLAMAERFHVHQSIAGHIELVGGIVLVISLGGAMIKAVLNKLQHK